MQGYTYVPYFAPKHRLWVHVTTASDVLSKNKKNIIFFSAENFQFLNLKQSLIIAWASFRNVTSTCPCKIQRLFTAVKFDNFIRKEMFSNFAQNIY